MTENKYPVAMFKQVNGERVQIGWASPVDPETNSRTFEKIAPYQNEPLSDVSFEDDELSQKAAAKGEGHEAELDVVHNTVIEPTQEELDAIANSNESDDNYPQAGDEGKDSAPLQVDNNETVEINAGGAITDVAGDEDEEDEEAAFERELAEEQAQLEREEAEAPQTRREARENEENN